MSCRSTSVRQQEAAALKAELQQTTAAAEAAAVQHQQELQQAQQAHAAAVAELVARHHMDLQQQLEGSAAAHNQQLSQLCTDLQQQLSRELSTVHAALGSLQLQQQSAVAASETSVVECMQEACRLADSWQQLQEVRSELAAVQADARTLTRLAAGQQALLQDMQRHQAKLAPQGLEALAQQAEEAAAAKWVFGCLSPAAAIVP